MYVNHMFYQYNQLTVYAMRIRDNAPYHLRNMYDDDDELVEYKYSVKLSLDVEQRAHFSVFITLISDFRKLDPHRVEIQSQGAT